MKGLLIKDILTLVKQAKIFLLFIVVFSLMPGNNTVSFAIVYAMLLPVTALAYDERCKWDQLAAMMPYSTTQLVISKYVLGLVCMLAAMAISYVATFVQSAINPQNVVAWNEYIAILAGSTAAGMLMQTIMLPVLFRIGTEKGRLILMAMLVLISLRLCVGELKLFRLDNQKLAVV